MSRWIPAIAEMPRDAGVRSKVAEVRRPAHRGLWRTHDPTQPRGRSARRKERAGSGGRESSARRSAIASRRIAHTASSSPQKLDDPTFLFFFFSPFFFDRTLFDRWYLSFREMQHIFERRDRRDFYFGVIFLFRFFFFFVSKVEGENSWKSCLRKEVKKIGKKEVARREAFFFFGNSKVSNRNLWKEIGARRILMRLVKKRREDKKLNSSTLYVYSKLRYRACF